MSYEEFYNAVMAIWKKEGMDAEEVAYYIGVLIAEFEAKKVTK